MLEARMKTSRLSKTILDVGEDENEAAEQGNQAAVALEYANPRESFEITAKSADSGALRLISVLGLVSTQARSKELI
jgi:hypothetical protein